MGILIRFVLSLGGAVVGALTFAGAFAAVFLGAAIAFQKFDVLSRETHQQFDWLFVLGLAVCAGLLGIRGAMAGYKVGLKMGRDICYAPVPEQNARVQLTVGEHGRK